MRVACVWVGLLLGISAQSHVLTVRHKARLETVTDSSRHAQLLQRYLKKDSVRYRKKKRQLEQKLKGVLRDSITALPGFIKIDKLSISEMDSAPWQKNTWIEKGKKEQLEEVEIATSPILTDSATRQVLPQRAKRAATEYLAEELDVEGIDISIDSLNTKTVSHRIEQEAEARLKEHLQKGDGTSMDILSDQKKALDQLKQNTDMDQAKQQMKAKMANHAREFITQHAEKLQQIQGKMGELKRKYSYVPNGNDLSQAKKRTSLKDEPLSRRLTFGGNFTLSKTNPAQLDLSTTVGYQVNTRFELGATAMYRSRLEVDRKSVKAGNERTYGYSFYLRHMVFKNFFGYAEGENISRMEMVQDQPERSWTQTLLLGIGRELNIARRIQFQTVITYNFLHENRDGIYGSPVVFKTGVRVSK